METQNAHTSKNIPKKPVELSAALLKKKGEGMATKKEREIIWKVYRNATDGYNSAKAKGEYVGYYAKIRERIEQGFPEVFSERCIDLTPPDQEVE